MEQKYKLSFATLDPYLESHIVKPIEVTTNRGFVTWGKNNDYPTYIYGLYQNVATLKSIIDGVCDYIVGEGVTIDGFEVVNSHGETAQDVFAKCALDYVIHGGFALNILRNRLGGIAEIYRLNVANIRTNEDKSEFYYTKDWSKSYGRVKYIAYPAYKNDGRDASSIFYYSNNINEVYPIPIYGASLMSCEVEKAINEFQLNSINNGFSGSYIVNFNSGVPDDEQKEEIENAFYEKFCGYQNGSRPMIAWNNNKEGEVTVSKISGDDFADRYSELAKRSRQEIFTSFRATPNLFGLPTETTGFSQQEFMESFKLFNKTMIQPIQKMMITQFEKIFGKDKIHIEPFTINWDE